MYQLNLRCKIDEFIKEQSVMRIMSQYVLVMFSTIIFTVGTYGILNDYWTLDIELIKVIILFGIAVGIGMSMIVTKLNDRVRSYNII